MEIESQKQEIDNKIIKKKDGIEKNLPWVEKYRPHQISDLISHKYIIETLHKFVFE